MKDEIKILCLAIAWNLLLIIPMISSHSDKDKLFFFLLLGFFDFILFSHLIFGDRIIDSLLRIDLKDFEQGYYWTPFGKRKIPRGTTIEKMTENSKEFLRK